MALYRASGITARYARGTLEDALAQQLILTMFPAPLRMIGCLEPGTPLSDPANDPELLAEAQDHFWVELDLGGGLIPADTTIPAQRSGRPSRRWRTPSRRCPTNSGTWWAWR